MNQNPMNQNQNLNIFFYCDNNSKCEQVYLILKTNNLIPSFRCVNVETTKISFKLKEVPAILIYKLKQIYYNQELYKFLNVLIQQQQKQIQHQRIIQQHQQYYQPQQYQANLQNIQYNQTQPQLINNMNSKDNIYNNRILQNMNSNMSILNSNNQQFDPRLNQQNNIQQQLIKKNQNIMKGPVQKKILGYVENEMNGLSDIYTFQDPNVNITPQHNFVNITDEIKIYTGNDNNILTANDTIKTLNKLKQIRETEEKNIQKQQKLSQNDKNKQDMIKQINDKLQEYADNKIKNDLLVN